MFKGGRFDFFFFIFCIYYHYLYCLKPQVVVFNRMAICTFRAMPYKLFVKLVYCDVSAHMDIMP